MSAGRVHETCNLVMKSLKKKGSEMTVIGHNHIRKVETFDGYDIIAHPLPARDERVYYPTEPDSCSAGVTYASHDVMVARPTGIGTKGRLAIFAVLDSELARATYELQSLMRISYAVLCMKNKTH